MYIIIVDELFQCIYASAVKRLITINPIQNKCFCLRNISVYNYYVYINTNTCCIYLRKYVVYILNIFIYNIHNKIYTHILCKQFFFFFGCD